MRISVITAVYNSEKTVAQAVRSVANQGYSDVEHVIVEGASMDSSLDVIRREQNERVNLVSEPDTGIYDALNKGIARATGDVIGLVHSDDYLADEQVLSRVARVFADSSVEAAYGDLDYVSNDSTGRVIRHWSPGAFRPAKLKRGWMPPHPTLYLRRSVFDRIGIYDDSYGIAADYDFILRYFGQTTAVPAYIPHVLVKMRVGGVSNQNLARVWEKMTEDYRALKHNGVGGLGTLAAKNISKLPQFVVRAQRAK